MLYSITDGTNNLSTITGAPDEHRFIIVPVNTVVFTVNDQNVPVVGGNILLYVTASTKALNGSNGDFLEMVWSADASRYESVIERVRT